MRNHLLHLYALRHGVGHGTLDAVACGEPNLALVHHEEYKQSVVRLLLAYTPRAEQLVTEVEDVGIADRGQHNNRRLYAGRLLQSAQYGVY